MAEFHCCVCAAVDGIFQLRASQPTESETTEYETALCSTAQLMSSVRQIEQVRRQVDPLDLSTLDCRLTLAFYGVAQVLVDFLQTKDTPTYEEHQQQEPVGDRIDSDGLAAADPSSRSSKAVSSAADAGTSNDQPSPTCCVLVQNWGVDVKYCPDFLCLIHFTSVSAR